MFQALIRSVRPSDLGATLRLLCDAGLSTEGVAEHFQRFFVAEVDGEIVGCVGLEYYKPISLLRSLAVTKEYRRQGLGTRLIRNMLSEAVSLSVHEIALLTTTAEEFFGHFGFEKISREETSREIRQSVEFQSSCPATATCMRLQLVSGREFDLKTKEA